jgi:hypothetical protein
MQRRFSPLQLRSLALTILSVIALFSTYSAQTSRGTVSGTITDTNGAVIAGAKIDLVNKATSVARTTTSNDVGIYRFDAVDLGKYDVKITQQGFKQYVATDLDVTANITLTIDAPLQVGVNEQIVEVNAASEALLIKDAPIRGGNISSMTVTSLPVSGIEPLSLARILPGVVQAVGSSTFGNGGQNTQFSVNGQRPRGNNYLLDGTENNDISIGGNAQAFNMLDAVQEVSVQTSNFGAEFGRGGGGVFNVITKSGTNNIHGSVYEQYRSQIFNSRPNTDVLNNVPLSVFNRNIYGFSLGGPIRKNKTFAFGSWQQDRFRSTNNYSFVIPTEATVARLNQLFPGNARLKLYLDAIGSMRGTANPVTLQLGPDASGTNRGTVDFATTVVGLASPSDNTQWVTRIDHSFSERHLLAGRYTYNKSLTSPNGVNFPGYIFDFTGFSQNYLVTDTFSLSSTISNEFRFSFGQIQFNFPINTDKSVAQATTLPFYSIPNISTPGIQTNIPQFRFADNYLIQETQTAIVGTHTFRYGMEVLKQVARQRPPFVERGSFTYTNVGTTYSGFVNFLEDFSGPSGASTKNFGDPVYRPNLLRHSYFFQDTWKMRPSFSLTLGIRYENFGQPANSAFRFPAYAGPDPAQFTVPNRVNPDNNNFGPSIGFAWTPSFRDGILGAIVGEGKTVIRSGYQVSYDTFFNNLLSNMAADTPNTIATTFNAPNSGRGAANFSTTLPATARTPNPLTDQQTSVFDKNIRNPYTQRWSLGIQRELPWQMMLDVSYVGTGSRKLFTSEDINYRKTDGTRIYPQLGVRRIRSSQGNASYNGLQTQLVKRLSKGFDINLAYSFSRNIDSTSEVFGSNSSPSPLTSLPIALGGLKLDRALSDYHRKHRFTVAYTYELPGPKSGFLHYPFGGWKLSGISTFQSGAPYTISNGFDRNNDGIANDRPDIGNPSAPINTRALVVATTVCSTGFRNPDTTACVTPNDVRWIQGTGLPNASTVGRNTLLTNGQAQWDMSIFKNFNFTESKRLELRLETLNIFNHPQFILVPSANVVTSAGPNASTGRPSRFLNKDYTNSGTRGMWVQAKIVF